MDLKITQKEDGVTLYEGQETAQDYTNFSIIPTWIMRHPDLQANDKLVYALIYSFNTHNKEFFGSNAFIAGSLNVSTPTVQRILTKLERLKLVVRKFKDGHREFVSTHITDDMVPISQMIPPHITDDTPPYRPRYHTKIYTKKVTKKDIIIPKGISENTSQGSQDINILTDYLKEKKGKTLDGTIKDNRNYCYNLIRKIKKDYPDKDPVKAIKALIDLALSDEFHSGNATGFKYIYYNTQKIISSYQSKSKSNLVII